MRPLRVEMQAFGPYAGRQVLDFADLKGARFFLIHGPTGSGKTTILDAMAFGLYGDTSGAERTAADMRNRHVDPGVLTEVVFDFALGAERYRVWRRPAQERPKLRGEGTTTEPQDATLWRLPDASSATSGDDHPEGRPLANGWRQVTEACERLLGFRAAQFRQVVMLPQGKFQELLRADSPGREEILAKLFGTEHFARLGQELKEQASAQHKELERLADRRDLILRSAGLADEQDLPAALEGARQALTDASRERARLDQARATADATLQDAEAVAEKLAAARRAAEALEQLEALRPQIEGLAEELRLGAAADRLRGQAAAVERSRTDAERVRDEVAVLEQADAEARSCREQAAAALAAEKAREAQRRQLARRLDELHRLVGWVASLAEAQEQHRAAEEALRRAAEQVAHAEAARRRAQEHYDKARAELEQARACAAGEQACRQAAAAARAVATRRRELDGSLEASRAAEQQCARRVEAVAAAETRWQAARAELEAVESAWVAGQAALLAAGLRPGEPCPVCGSTTHPAPAAADAEPPDAAALAAARDAVAAALADRDAATKGHADAAAAAAEAKARHEALVTALGDAADRSTEACERDAEVAERAAAHATDAAQTLADLEHRLASAEAALQAADDGLATARQTSQEATKRVAEAQTACLERGRDVPEELREQGALQREITATDAELSELRRALDTADEEARRAECAAADAGASLNAGRSRLEAAEEALRDALRDFEDGLRAEGFVTFAGEPDHDSWRAALREPQRLRGLEQQIRSWEQDVAAARGRAAEAGRAAAGLVAPDLERLRSAATAAKVKADEAAEAAADARHHLDRLIEAEEQLAEMRRAAAAGEQRYATVGRLARVVNGDNPLHLTLQRFVLGAYLDAVLTAADRRLLLLSKGRYRLIRTDEQRGGRRTAGLDLDVYDAWTGYERPVSTLSGGESFMAALSLALGLAETVQAYSGGVYLDTVFIDEGFGTLDDEALDLAVATLMDLQQGDRLVGIISHVAELRERIDAQLRVTAERGTSTASFVVP